MPAAADESKNASTFNPLPISTVNNNKGSLSASQTTDTSSIKTKHSPLHTPIGSTFDWETDGEDAGDLGYNDSKLKKKTTTTVKKTKFNGCILWFSRWPHFVRTLMYIILGGIFFMIPGMASYWFCIKNEVKGQYMTKGWAMYDDSDTCGFAMGPSPGRIPGFVLFVWFSVSWASYWGNRYLFAVLPNVLVRVTSLFVKFTINDEKFAAKVAHTIDYIGFLRKFISLFVWGVTNNFTWAIFFRTIEGAWQSESDWRYVVQRVLSCIMFGFMILLIEKTFLQIISVGFHKRAYHQRILDHDKANKVLIRLNRGRKKVMKSKGMFSSSETLESDGEPAVLHERLDKHFRMFADKAAKAGGSFGKGFASVLGAAVGLDIGGAAAGVILRTPADVRILAKKLFEAICRRGLCNDLRLEDFTPFFHTPEEAKEAFDLFDRDGNGDVTKSEFKSVVRSIYEEGVQLDFSLRQSSQAISKLDDLFKVFMYVIILFTCLAIFKVDTTQFMAAAISLWLGVVFAIGGTIKNLVESIIFLFITHPYDVGDKVEVDGTSYFVKKFGLMTTVFTGVDGKEIYAPNIQLASKFLHNFRRSGPTGESINFRFSFKTPWLKIKQLETFLRKYVENEESRDFVPSIEIKVTHIVSNECLNCSIWLEHKSNWQSGGDKSTRTNRFLLKAKEGIEIFEIELAKVWITEGKL